MLSCCAIEMKENFYQWISQVVETLVPLLKFSGNDKVRMAAISAMPDLLHSAVLAKDKGPYDGSDSSSIQKFVDDAIPSLVQVLDKEPEQENSARTISILKRCIEIPGMHVKSFQVKLIVDEVKKILESISKRNSEIVNRVKSDDFNIEDDKFLKRQKEQNVEIVNQIGGCLESLIGKLKIDFLPFFDELLPYMIVMLANDKPTKEKQTSFHIFNSVMQHCQEVAIKYYNTYLPFLLKACEGENPIVLQEAALGIGICAEFGGSDFKPYIGVVLSCLNAMLECPYELGSDGAKAYDKAVSALGKICEFHSRSINAEQVLSTWLSHLPIRNDLIEAKLVHEKLCEMVEKQDTELRCPKNLPKVISVFAEVISQHEKLASEETCEKMMNFLRKIKLDPPSDLEEVISSLHPQQQDLLKTIF
ncbi:uncharacterized protein LOC131159918 isoform X1 [Malania oleifera]|uniref:uncharacterized protein LOC131159918 isoform X1 n=1 Tax=Malania oleifera TaxID=397392 RepID=UPI0025ADEA5C|nr:uncharacterized protein LOC131159918 isoform X1 [Malania oleifera]